MSPGAVPKCLVFIEPLIVIPVALRKLSVAGGRRFFFFRFQARSVCMSSCCRACSQ